MPRILEAWEYLKKFPVYVKEGSDLNLTIEFCIEGYKIARDFSDMPFGVPQLCDEESHITGSGQNAPSGINFELWSKSAFEDDE